MKKLRNAAGEFKMPGSYPATVQAILDERLHAMKLPGKSGGHFTIERTLVARLEPRAPAVSTPGLSLMYGGEHFCDAGDGNEVRFNISPHLEAEGYLAVLPDTPETVPHGGFYIEFICRAPPNVPFRALNYPAGPDWTQPRTDHDQSTQLTVVHAHMERMPPEIPCDGPGLMLKVDNRPVTIRTPIWDFFQARIYTCALVWLPTPADKKANHR